MENESFVLYASKHTRIVLFHPEFRRFWKFCMKPMYVAPGGSNLNSFDFKTNPRRCHPFASHVYHWYIQTQSYARSWDPERTPFPDLNLPVLLLSPCSHTMPLHWRDGFTEVEIERITRCFVSDASSCVTRLQRKWKAYIYWRLKFRKCLDQIENEVAYEYGKYKMQEVKEHFLEQAHQLMKGVDV